MFSPMSEKDTHNNTNLATSGTDTLLGRLSPLSCHEKELSQAISSGCDAGSSPVPHAELRARMLSYQRATADAITESCFSHTLGVINPRSGEKAAAALVQRGMVERLGKERVLTLSEEMFTDPCLLRHRIKEKAVIYHVDKLACLVERGEPAVSKRGTIVVAGGDGTISFVLDQMHYAQEELKYELRILMDPPSAPAPPEAAHDEDSECDSCNNKQQEGPSRGSARAVHIDSSARRCCFVKQLFTFPALASLPLGTGNDFSNCVGFGSAFSHFKVPVLCCGCESNVDALLYKSVQSPSVPLDRWAVELVPLRVAQQYLQTLAPTNDNVLGSCCDIAAVKGGRPGSAFYVPLQGTEEKVRMATAVSGATACSHGQHEVKMANLVHHVDWKRLRRETQPPRYCATNYIGIGYDAYVTCQFAKTRKKFPWLCHSRVQNKAIYGIIALKAAGRCKHIQNLMPIVCVPNPFPASVSIGLTNTTTWSAGKSPMVALKLPRHTKALVLTNVNCYSSGSHPWLPTRGDAYYHPVEIRDTALVSVERTSARKPVNTPVYINDRKFELQAMGGLADFMLLGVGMSGSTKIIQTHEAFIFVLCTPEDLRCGRHTSHASAAAADTSDGHPSSRRPLSSFTKKHFEQYEKRIEDSRVRASLNIQVDGEAVNWSMEPTIIHVSLLSKTPIHVRCRNFDVVR